MGSSADDDDFDVDDPQHRPCQVVRAIDSKFGVVEEEPCNSKYPILCRYW